MKLYRIRSIIDEVLNSNNPESNAYDAWHNTHKGIAPSNYVRLRKAIAIIDGKDRSNIVPKSKVTRVLSLTPEEMIFLTIAFSDDDADDGTDPRYEEDQPLKVKRTILDFGEYTQCTCESDSILASYGYASEDDSGSMHYLLIQGYDEKTHEHIKQRLDPNYSDYTKVEVTNPFEEIVITYQDWSFYQDEISREVTLILKKEGSPAKDTSKEAMKVKGVV